MPGRVGVSLPALHWFLWEHRNPDTGTVEVKQAQLGEDLAVGRARAGQVLAGMVNTGRLAKTDRRSVYFVNDPASFVGANDS